MGQVGRNRAWLVQRPSGHGCGILFVISLLAVLITDGQAEAQVSFTQITSTTGSYRSHRDPSINADGIRIAFTSDRNLTGGNADGNDEVFLATLTAPPTSLAAALLPTSRSVQVGAPATAFATIINAGPVTATGCSLAPVTALPAGFTYQTTDAGNLPTGTPNTPIDIPVGVAQSFVFAVTPTAPIPSTDVLFNFRCANADPASSIAGVNTLLLVASATPVPDIIALGATSPNDGILRLSSAGAFGVATANVGAGGLITVMADTGGVTLPISIQLCQTNPATGQCISAIGPSVMTQINAGATPTFSIFATSSGPIPFDPATNRIFVRFTDGGGVTRGATSVAVCTTPGCA